ncbi:MAG TPA: hypothetical protein VMD52_06755 [Patescibacteria group bacterium]|nr:hypothetical protein [Patescibacteria group bacterium]
MRYVLTLLAVSAAFAAGYLCGRAGVVTRAPQVAPARPAAPVTVPKQAANQGTVKGYGAFQEVMRDSFVKVGDLQSKINNMRTVAEYLRRQTEDAIKAGSLEGSMVVEVRYRESLSALLGLEDQLNALLASSLQAANSYVSFLAQEIPSLPSAAK